MNLYYLGAIIIIILILLWFVMTIKSGFSNNILTGYWQAPDDFLEKNSISRFDMAISKPDGSTRDIYIIMQDLKGNMLVNEKGTIKLNKTWSSSNPWGKKIKYNAKLVIESEGIPSDLEMIYDPIAGFITLYSDDTIYAELYRNNMLSDLDIKDNDD